MTHFDRQPKALPFLFLTEMWERFGFYVVQGMLVLYMTESFGYSDDQSFTISGAFTALAYIAPMLGGIIADRLLGFKTSIVWGGIFLSSGYALLALSWHHGFYLSLATIIVGNGLFKPNISSLLGTLYKPGDAGRDSGFTLFYIGINLGVLLAGICSGTIKDRFGWHAGFALASIGLLIGLATFAAGIKWGDMHYQPQVLLKDKKFLTKPWLLIYCLASIAAVRLLLQSETLANWLLPIIGVFLLFYLFILAFNQPPEDRNRLITLNILIISSVVFWTLYWQIFLSVNLYIDRLVNRQVFSFHIPTTVFYTAECIFIILLGPLLSWSWQTLGHNNRNPSSLLKFVLAIVFVGLGFLVLTISTFFPDSIQLINPLWILFAYFLITVGELLLSPIGLSAVTLLSPRKYTGMMMGIWFVSLGFGGHFAGLLAKLASIPETTAATSIMQLPIYRMAFFKYALLAFIMSAVLFLVQLRLSRMRR